MKFSLPLILSITTFFLGACAMFEAKQSATPQGSPKNALSVPVGENWQITEEAPNLSGDRLPFQTEKSVQPAGTGPVLPPDKVKIETTQ